MTETLEIKTDKGFVARLKEVVGKKSVRSFAEKCDISDTALRQYLSGKSEPTRLPLIAIARAGKVNIEWLATGEGYRNNDFMDSIKQELLSSVIVAVETYLVGSEIMNMDVKEKATIIALIYDEMNKRCLDFTSEDVMNKIKGELEDIISIKKILHLASNSGITFKVLEKLVSKKKYYDSLHANKQ